MMLHDSSEEIYNEQIFDCFEDKKERRKFIRKTFGLFLLSILTTFGSCLEFKYNDYSKDFVKSETGQVLTSISFFGTIMSLCITMCFDNLLRKNPTKYIIYGLFTGSISWLVGISTLYIKSDLLISAIFITSGTTITLTLYALVSKNDFTGYTEYYLVTIVAIMLTGIINVFLNNSLLYIIIVGFGCLLFSLMIVYDIQMIVAQKHIRHKFLLDDSVLAAMSLYIDTVNLFIYILDLLTLTDRN